MALDAEARALFEYAARCYEQSAGAFDITAGVLRTLWHRDRHQPPDAAERRAVLEHIGWPRVQCDAEGIRLRPGMQIDLGGVVKEYAADAIAQALRTQGLRHGLVDLGGDINVIGPHPDGSPWQLGVRHPERGPEVAIAHTELFAGGIATSGSYERFVEIAGRRYSHLLDARTGAPVADAPLSVTVLAPQAIVAGSLATLAALQPAAQAATWLRDTGARFVLVNAALDCLTEAEG